MIDSKKMTNKLLPIGTVVQLVDRKQKVMIIGRNQINIVDNTSYDYSGCLYPDGMDGDNIILFDAEHIIMIYHLGYQDLDELNQRLILVDSMIDDTDDENGIS